MTAAVAGAACAIVAAALSLPAQAASSDAGHGSESGGHALGTSTRLYVPKADSAAALQEVKLRKSSPADAAALAAVESTPQAVWLTGGSPGRVKGTVKNTMALAKVSHTTPVFVAYDIPGRDCSQYSAGGAATTAAYEAWIDGIAQGIGSDKAVVLVEPDGLGLLPQTDCIATHGLSPDTYPFTDAERFTELNYAVSALEARPNTTVYLDGTHSAWLNVGDISTRLVEAGVNAAQGFFLNVSNYQYTVNNEQYGTWISECIALLGAGTAPGDCPNQYWNGGPEGTKIADLVGPWTGGSATGALDNYGKWSDTTDDPALNTSGINARYSGALAAANVTPSAHFVIDTSRNGTGPNPMTAYTAAPYDQPASNVAALAGGNWCNPPGAGLGASPTTDTGVALVDAFLWVKTPGQSDGSCNASGAGRVWDYSAYTQPGWPMDAAGQASFDPLWGQVDPDAGAWFPAQILQLMHNADGSVN
ncbi:glycoside hydrolase family 6 protein [Planctomonas sp. JC2975]|nr:glycoside hydrolase family 6 protein [Planctomonas sp. JC2975]